MHQTGFGCCKLDDDQMNHCLENNYCHVMYVGIYGNVEHKKCEWCLYQNETGFCVMDDDDTKYCVENDLCYWEKFVAPPAPNPPWHTHTFRLNDGQEIKVSTNGISVRVVSLNHIFAELTLVEERNYGTIPENKIQIDGRLLGRLEIGELCEFITKDEMII
jgi:hypothetical protein